MTKRRVIIHGGLHKTGTTSLQAQLHGNRDRLLERGIFAYRKDQKRGENHTIPKAFRDRIKSPLLEAQINEFKRSNCHTLLISSEGFSRLLRLELAAFLKELTEFDVSGIITFRHPVSHAASIFCSRGGYAGRQNIKAFFARTVEGERQSFARVMDDWRSLFGPKKFHPLRYEDHVSMSKPIAELMGIDINSLSAAKLRVRKSAPLDVAMLNSQLYHRLAAHMDDKSYRTKIYNSLLQFAESDAYKAFCANTEMGKMGMLETEEQEEILHRNADALQQVEKILGKPATDDHIPYTKPLPYPKPSQQHIQALEAAFWDAEISTKDVSYVD